MDINYYNSIEHITNQCHKIESIVHKRINPIKVKELNTLLFNYYYKQKPKNIPDNVFLNKLSTKTIYDICDKVIKEEKRKATNKPIKSSLKNKQNTNTANNKSNNTQLGIGVNGEEINMKFQRLPQLQDHKPIIQATNYQSMIKDLGIIDERPNEADIMSHIKEDKNKWLNTRKAKDYSNSLANNTQYQQELMNKPIYQQPFQQPVRQQTIQQPLQHQVINQPQQISNQPQQYQQIPPQQYQIPQQLPIQQQQLLQQPTSLPMQQQIPMQQQLPMQQQMIMQQQLPIQQPQQLPQQYQYQPTQQLPVPNINKQPPIRRPPSIKPPQQYQQQYSQPIQQSLPPPQQQQSLPIQTQQQLNQPIQQQLNQPIQQQVKQDEQIKSPDGFMCSNSSDLFGDFNDNGNLLSGISKEEMAKFENNNIHVSAQTYRA